MDVCFAPSRHGSKCALVSDLYRRKLALYAEGLSDEHDETG